MIRALLSSGLAGAAVALPTVVWAQAAPTPLDEVVITGARQAGFAASAVQVGAFRNARVIDTPLTVNVIPREVLDAQQAQGLYDALRNTGGVTRSQLNGATYDNVAIRGILVENRGNYRLNGSLPVINLIEQPLEDKTRVEVLKGASGLYYGFVPPSGVINLTTKRPTARPVADFMLSGDDHGSVVGAVDLGRRWGARSEFGARVNLASGQLATGQDKVEGTRQLAALALDWNATERLSFKFDGELINKRITEPAAIALLPAVNGVITLPKIPDPRQNLTGDWQDYDAHAENWLARADYQLSKSWAVTLEGGQARTTRNRFFSQFQNYNLTTGAGTLRIFPAEGQAYKNDNWRAELAGSFATGPIGHQLTLGYTSNVRFQNGRSRASFDVPQNLYTPLVIRGGAYTTALTTNPSRIEDQGVYALDRMTWGPVQAIAGVRRSSYESRTMTTRYTADATSPALAVIYKPRSWFSLYATYLEGLEEGGTAPANAANAFEVLPPATSKQWEAGAKAEVRRVIGSVAYFEITRPSAFLNAASGRFALDGETEYRGVEASVQGEVVPRVSLIASALWLDASLQRAADLAVIGKRPENTPEWTGSVFAEWRPPQVEGLGLNAGVFYVGERAVNARNQAFVGDYATLAFGVRFERELFGKRVAGQINVENALDEAYWNAAGNGLLGVGSPRTIRFRLSTSL